MRLASIEDAIDEMRADYRRNVAGPAVVMADAEIVGKVDDMEQFLEREELLKDDNNYKTMVSTLPELNVTNQGII